MREGDKNISSNEDKSVDLQRRLTDLLENDQEFSQNESSSMNTTKFEI